MDMDRTGNIIKTAVVLLLTTLLGSCFNVVNKQPLPKYGMEFNEERKKIGLPVLQGNWNYIWADGYKEFGNVWVNPICDTDISIPYYFKKSTGYNNDTIISESDCYVGTRKFETIDGTFEEMLYITYYFADKQWKYVFRGEYKSDEFKYSHLSNFDLTKSQADSILKSWNIDRELK